MLNGIAAPQKPAATPVQPWLLVFDLDGTLIDSSRDLIYAVNISLRQVGAPPLGADLITTFIGDGAQALVRRALAASAGKSALSLSSPLFDQCYRAFLEAYRVHKLDTTRPYAGVLEALAAIRQRAPQLLMAVLTNKPVRPSREICYELGLSAFFFANYGGDSFSTKKPDPFGLRMIAEEARTRTTMKGPLSIRDVIMIGDAPPDVFAARNAGATSMGCLYGLSSESLIEAQPDLLVNSPGEWLSALHL